MKLYNVLIIATILLCNLSVSGQVIKGIVKGDKGETIPYASIVVCDKADSVRTNYFAFTDVNGAFELKYKPIIDHKMALNVSCLGYNPKEILLPLENSNIVLSSSSIALGEAKVVASKEYVKLKGNGLVYDVRHSPLAVETSTTNILGRIPGLKCDNSKLTTVFGETPSIYVDGKRIFDMTQVNNLMPDQIKSIELINNPGAQYDSSEKVVVRIETKKKLAGIYLLLDEELRKNSFFSHVHRLNLNYSGKRLDLSTMLQYGNQKQGSEQNRIIEVGNEDLYKNYLDMEATKNKRQSLSFMFSLNYTLTKDMSIGGMYQRRAFNIDSDFTLDTKTFKNDLLDQSQKGLSVRNNDRYADLVNVFFTDRFNKKSSLSIYADYLKNNMESTQSVVDKSTIDASMTYTNVNSPSDYNMYALKSIYEWKGENYSMFHLGAELSRVEGDGHTDYKTRVYNNLAYSLSENKYAAFASYSFNVKKSTIYAGLRYEFVKSENNNLLDRTEDIHKDYHHLLPNISMWFPLGKLQNSFSGSVKVNRPSFSSLGSSSSYLNQFQREQGNPNLQPEISYQLQYMVSYKHFNAQAQYRYVKDYMAMDITTDPIEKNTSVFTWNNYDNYKQFRLFLSYSKRFKNFEPSYTVAYIQPFLQLNYMGGHKDLDKPTYYLDLRNRYYISKNCLINFDYTYTSGGVSQIYTTEAVHRFNASVQARFFKQKLAVALDVQDIFKKDIDHLNSYINSTYIRSIEDNDRHSVGLHLTWHFNHQNKGYKGRMAGEKEMNRI